VEIAHLSDYTHCLCINIYTHTTPHTSHHHKHTHHCQHTHSYTNTYTHTQVTKDHRYLVHVSLDPLCLGSTYFDMQDGVSEIESSPVVTQNRYVSVLVVGCYQSRNIRNHTLTTLTHSNLHSHTTHTHSLQTLLTHSLHLHTSNFTHTLHTTEPASNKTRKRARPPRSTRLNGGLE
jgi:hypothetical protein